MFGNLMGHLMKAKETLDSEKPKLTLQQSNFDRIDQRNDQNVKEVRDKQKLELDVVKVLFLGKIAS